MQLLKTLKQKFNFKKSFRILCLNLVLFSIFLAACRPEIDTCLKENAHTSQLIAGSENYSIDPKIYDIKETDSSSQKEKSRSNKQPHISCHHGHICQVILSKCTDVYFSDKLVTLLENRIQRPSEPFLEGPFQPPKSNFQNQVKTLI